jgi:hypothetical protein
MFVSSITCIGDMGICAAEYVELIGFPTFCHHHNYAAMLPLLGILIMSDGTCPMCEQLVCIRKVSNIRANVSERKPFYLQTDDDNDRFVQ